MYDINNILLEPKLQAIENRFNRQVLRGAEEDCWLWTGAQTRVHYGSFKVRERMFLSHRVAYLLHHRSFPLYAEDGRYACACHRCDTPLCMNPAHLFIGSTVDNNHDRHHKGRSSGGKLSGEACSWHKLTEADVLAIHADHDTAPVVGAKYGVSESLIYQIRKGVTWKHLHPRNASSSST